MQETCAAAGHFATPHARKYMTQLCKHFGHKVPAGVVGDTGHVTFDAGTARFEADDQTLTAILRADSRADLDRLRHVVDDHLKRFAFREDFTAMDWDGLAA